VWGYSHINFFAPMSRFGSGGRGPVAAAQEFKEMVKEWVAGGLPDGACCGCRDGGGLVSDGTCPIRLLF
jgi:hypothetical protein